MTRSVDFLTRRQISTDAHDLDKENSPSNSYVWERVKLDNRDAEIGFNHVPTAHNRQSSPFNSSSPDSISPSKKHSCHLNFLGDDHFDLKKCISSIFTRKLITTSSNKPAETAQTHANDHAPSSTPSATADYDAMQNEIIEKLRDFGVSLATDDDYAVTNLGGCDLPTTETTDNLHLCSIDSETAVENNSPQLVNNLGEALFSANETTLNSSDGLNAAECANRVAYGDSSGGSNGSDVFISLASFQNSDFYKIPRCRSVEHTPMNPIYTHSDRNNYNGAGTGYVSQPHRVSLHDQSHRFHTAEQPRSITPSYQLQAAPSFVNADHHHFRRSSTPHQNQQNSSPRVDHKKVLDSFTRLMQISSDSKSMNNGGVNNPLEMQNNFPNMRHPSGHAKIHGTTSSQRGAYNGNFVPQNYSAPLNSPAMIIDTNFCGFCKNNGESDKVYKGHRLKDFYGRVVCPVLRSYVCPICNASGDSAHTIKYCPMGNKDESYKFKLHETPRTSSGLRKNTK